MRRGRDRLRLELGRPSGTADGGAATTARERERWSTKHGQQEVAAVRSDEECGEEEIGCGSSSVVPRERRTGERRRPLESESDGARSMASMKSRLSDLMKNAERKRSAAARARSSLGNGGRGSGDDRSRARAMEHEAWPA